MTKIETNPGKTYSEDVHTVLGGDNFCCPAPSFLPSTAVLEMTYKCCHKCIFCSCPWFSPRKDFRTEKEMSYLKWKEVIDKLCTMGIMSIAFTGGEPLLKAGLVEIIRHAASCMTEHIETVNGQLVSRKAPPQLYLLSNGLRMSDKILDLCAEFKINLSMSLPGLRTFKEHTGINNAKGVLSWFEKAHAKGVTTTVGITVTQKNLFELFETISASFLAGADTLLMNRFLPGGRGLKYERDLCLNANQITEMLDTAEEVLGAANRYGSVGTELPKCIVNIDKYKRLNVGTRCSAALDFFVIDPSGYIRVCNHSTIRLNHVDEIDKVKSHPYWKTFVMKDYLPEKCSGCRLMVDCDGGCREAAHITGHSVDAPDPICEFL